VTHSNIERESGAADQVRVGYLEECLRHIIDMAGDYDAAACRQIRQVARQALRAGDPLTCPEARK
jgi:hypothetical protein